MTPYLLHGGDYNPEQWLHYAGVIDEDFRLFERARINALTVGVFSWAALEPEEGRFEFGWLDDIFARAERQGMRIILATPSGGKPNWLAHKYEEVRRVTRDGRREPQRTRHNHCLTSPVYREKVRAINVQLARRYGRHPALVLWHISNELNGYCFCPLCKQAFRDWLRAKYATLDALNEAWWARFWSHTITAWSQADATDDSVDGAILDWRRFMTHQCRTFIRNEVEPLREHSPGVPVTTNMMPFAEDYDYWELAPELDLISWDSYPRWHAGGDEPRVANEVALSHNLFRSMKPGRPFLLIESTPSQTNWMDVSPLKRPGLHRTASLQAVAHGADGVCYFQMRKGRGSHEQHHGAVIDHCGHPDTRVFREVTAVGEALDKLAGLVGSPVAAKVALIYDWPNRWALEHAATPQRAKNYQGTVQDMHRPFWDRGIAVDVIDSATALAGYELVVAPMLYLLRAGQAERLAAFVAGGGTLVATYQTGVVDETTLCWRGGPPGPLRDVLGLWVEEFDALPPDQTRRVEPVPAAGVAGASDVGRGLTGVYHARHYCELAHLDTATALAVYAEDFYAGRPAAMVNRHGRGRAYYLAARLDGRFLNDLLGELAADLQLPRALACPLPPGVTAQARGEGANRIIFAMNFNRAPAVVDLGGASYSDAETGAAVGGRLELPAFGCRLLRG